MIRAKCAACGKELDEPGGILFGPPEANENVRKRHLCLVCYAVVETIVEEGI